MAFEITSPAFANGEAIPSDFSCDGRDISPALTWTEPPAGTQSFALIMDDPDAPMGTWVHWVIFNIPASTRNLTEGTPTDPQLSDGSLQGKDICGFIWLSWTMSAFGHTSLLFQIVCFGYHAFIIRQG